MGKIDEEGTTFCTGGFRRNQLGEWKWSFGGNVWSGSLSKPLFSPYYQYYIVALTLAMLSIPSFRQTI